ncbi:MAG: hypothetical protein AUJ52_06060 [Elusimicrobia bacterium CG1_02_63_36]|nr:MAG: hypothetical protein AUJ52_06060 [Elusimicrobia bacterium CG1_02_63_36]PIP81417.1 MAG: hypothetical protein COR54_20365 [Elusimicrobia bacterium CG22_combo_CG10-13_8_21_14_all_63_91]PJA14940.1 MAG: hypothetical protein COX66_11400 [Elusimicrobia bacterium CG_4_10_14_0_2_um_filter_63_34]PJB24537.1 MAG: hypothetical protein CO113_13335 [Elusimicrobia bacterium CG_4_9_14_3_um_filter_62_55]
MNMAGRPASLDGSVRLERDWWPLTRLIVVGLGLYAASFVVPGWGEAAARLVGVGGEILRTAFGLMFVSPVVAHVYLGLMMVPIVIFVLLNDWIYDAAEAPLRRLTRSYPGHGARWTALGLELGVFAVLAEFLRRVFSAL